MSLSGAVDVAPSVWFLGIAHQPSAAAGVAIYSPQPSNLLSALQCILGLFALVISSLEVGFASVITNLHGLTTATAVSWGWRKEAVYLVAWATNAVILMLLYQVFDLMKSRILGTPQQVGLLQAAEAVTFTWHRRWQQQPPLCEGMKVAVACVPVSVTAFNSVPRTEACSSFCACFMCT